MILNKILDTLPKYNINSYKYIITKFYNNNIICIFYTVLYDTILTNSLLYNTISNPMVLYNIVSKYKSNDTIKN